MWWALLNAAACHDVTFPTSCDSEKFGWFGGAVVSSLTFHREESCQIRRFVDETVDSWIVLARVQSERFADLS